MAWGVSLGLYRLRGFYQSIGAAPRWAGFKLARERLESGIHCTVVQTSRCSISPLLVEQPALGEQKTAGVRHGLLVNSCRQKMPESGWDVFNRGLVYQDLPPQYRILEGGYETKHCFEGAVTVL